MIVGVFMYEQHENSNRPTARIKPQEDIYLMF